MTYFAEDILKLLESRLLERNISANMKKVGDKSYQALTVLPEPFDPEHPDRRNTIILWSLLSVSGDVSSDADQIKFFCKLGDNASAEQMPDLLKYLNYASTMLDFGTFGVDSTGQVGFSYSYPVIDHGDADAVAETLELAIGCITFALKTANMPLQRLLRDTVTVAEAKQLLKLLLEIINGHVDE